MIAADRDHLIDFRNELLKTENENSDIEAFRLANTQIEEYGKFLESCLYSNRWTKLFGEDGKFCYGTAQLIWNDNHKNYYKHVVSVKKESSRGKPNFC